MEIINGDIFNCTEDIIAHQTNCRGVMGGGVALQLKQLYPEVYRAYHYHCKTNIPHELLGTCLICEADNGKLIANLFGQFDYGCGLYTKYDKLEKAMIELRDYAQPRNKSIALPYNIGCGLAGGDWNVVSQIIDRVFKNYPVKLYKIGG